MELFVSSIYVLVFFILIYKWKIFRIEGLPKKDIAVAFFIKLLAALTLIWFYSSYYKDRHNSDIFKYFDDSLILTKSFFTNPKDFFSMLFGLEGNSDYLHQKYLINMNHWDSSYESTIFNESRLVIRINAIIGIISNNIYFVHAAFFSFFSLIGFTFFIKTLNLVFPKENHRFIFWALILFPSILIFSSGLLKEPILILSLGVCSYFLNQVIQNKKINILSTLFLIFSMLIILKIKFYVFCCLSPAILTFLIIKFSNKNPHILFLSCILSISFIFILLHLFSNNYDPIKIISKKQIDFIRLGEFYNAGSYFEINKIQNSFSSFISAIPHGFLNSFFRPFPTDISSKIHLIAFFENIIIFGFTSYILLKIKRLKEFIVNGNYALMYSTLVFVSFLYCIIGITTPVFGALIRYKVPALIFIIICLGLCLKKIQITRK